MKKVFIFLTVLAAFLAAFICMCFFYFGHESKCSNMRIERYDVEDFTKINAQGCDIEYIVDSITYVEYAAPKRHFDGQVINVEDGTLTLSCKISNILHSQRPKIRIASSGLKELQLANVTINIQSPINTDEFTALLMANSRLNAVSLRCEELDVDVMAASKVELQNVECEESDLSAIAASVIKIDTMQCKKTMAGANSASQVNILNGDVGNANFIAISAAVIKCYANIANLEGDGNAAGNIIVAK